MERLTIPDVRVDEHTTRRTMIDARAVKNHAMEFYWRLKAYEDTELTPEEIDMDHEAAEQLRQLCRDYDLGRLVNLAEADKAGRVVVLPCKVGDTVYRIFNPSDREPVISAHTLMSVDYIVRWLDKFGKTVFLTREEAEAALEATKDE